MNILVGLGVAVLTLGVALVLLLISALFVVVAELVHKTRYHSFDNRATTYPPDPCKE